MPSHYVFGRGGRAASSAQHPLIIKRASGLRFVTFGRPSSFVGNHESMNLNQFGMSLDVEAQTVAAPAPPNRAARFEAEANGRCQRALAVAPPWRRVLWWTLGLPLLVNSLGLRAGTMGSGHGTNGSAAVIVSLQGRVDIQRAGSGSWDRAQSNQGLQIRDRMRTGPRSRVTFQLSNQSVQRLDELSNLEILPIENSAPTPPIELKEGGLYFFNREKAVQQNFKTPQASGAILGTEFAVQVAPDGGTTVALYEGRIDLSNPRGAVTMAPGDQAEVLAGGAPRKTAKLEAKALVQWCLYYPAILDLDELGLDPVKNPALRASLDAYRSGDVLAAAAAHPGGGAGQGEPEAIYLAGLNLAAGQASAAEELVRGRTNESAEALRSLLTTVRGNPPGASAPGTSVSALLAQSYAAQGREQLELAQDLARRATERNPKSGYAWARLAELEFSLGRSESARTALARALSLSPRNAQAVALRGFVEAAQNRIHEAEAAFDLAITLDGGLANGWLGRGLCRIKRGEVAAGRADLQVAAATEPNRALLRSYLGKAWSVEGKAAAARRELGRANELDPADPTSWLYSALLYQQENRINSAINDLEHSRELNDHRAVYRSRFLLDQDRAMRSANLAGVYRDAGLVERSVREASRAVESDYSNYSAHRFLADSFYELRDPRQFNLRYETPWFTELLMAQLLAPVGAGSLSQYVSQQEYSKLFESDRLGISSQTEYWSRGDWQQIASQFGTLENTSYALDVDYRSERGWAPNTDSTRLTLYGKIKQQFTPQDSGFLLVNYNDYDTGDTRQYQNPFDASHGFRLKERQDPNLFLGWHHEWAPGHHTVVLAGRLSFDQQTSDTNSAVPVFLRANSTVEPTISQVRHFITGLDRSLEAYSVEAQQIAQLRDHTLVVGLRYQTGELNNTADLRWAVDRGQLPPLDLLGATHQAFKSDLQRFTTYLYDTWQVAAPLKLTAGLNYDRLDHPRNLDLLPLSPGEDTVDRVSPKLGLTWTPWIETHLRASWTRSLGGVSYDNSVRLEPVEVAGFNQAFRSLIPESVVGLVPGAGFETWGVGLDHKFPTRTYVSIVGERLLSEGAQTFGVFDVLRSAGSGSVSSAQRHLDYEERSAGLALNQLLGNRWSVGASYRWTEVDLDTVAVDLAPTIARRFDTQQQSVLQQVDLHARFNSECGFFAQSDVVWLHQSNRQNGIAPGREAFWQLNAFIGYRFLERRAEVRLGVLNLTDQDYRLNPLNVHVEYPRERTFYASVKLYF